MLFIPTYPTLAAMTQCQKPPVGTANYHVLHLLGFPCVPFKLSNQRTSCASRCSDRPTLAEDTTKLSSAQPSFLAFNQAFQPVKPGFWVALRTWLALSPPSVSLHVRPSKSRKPLAVFRLANDITHHRPVGGGTEGKAAYTTKKQ